MQATALPAGPRSVTVRVTDTGGNVVERGPYPVFAVTPSDRGALNGSNATETGALSMTWTRPAATSGGRSATARKAGVRGRLVNDAGVPIGGATVQLLTRDLRQRRGVDPAHDVHHRRATARFRATVTASASRLLQFALALARQRRALRRQRLPDAAGARERPLSVSTRRPRVGRTLTITGKLRGVSRGGVPIVVQGRAGGSRRYDTFADTTTSSQRPLPRPLPLPQRRLARALVRVPRAHPPRPALPVRDGLLEDRDRQSPLTLRSRLPPVYGHGRRER